MSELDKRPRETCRYGHPWVPGNIYAHPDKAPECRTCRRERMRAWQVRHPGYTTEKAREFRARLARQVREATDRAGRRPAYSGA